MPTETVYGLAADATSRQGRRGDLCGQGPPGFNPLIAHVPSVEAAGSARFDADAERLASAFWPGPLTLVLPRRADLPGQPARPRRARHAGPARAGPPAPAR